MAPSSTLPVRAAGNSWLRRLLILLAMVAVGGDIWQQLPGAGYPTDLTRVGAGTPTLVLAHDNSYLGGAAVMELMNDLRGDYAGRVSGTVFDISNSTNPVNISTEVGAQKCLLAY